MSKLIIIPLIKVGYHYVFTEDFIKFTNHFAKLESLTGVPTKNGVSILIISLDPIPGYVQLPTKENTFIQYNTYRVDTKKLIENIRNLIPSYNLDELEPMLKAQTLWIQKLTYPNPKTLGYHITELPKQKESTNKKYTTKLHT